jgi:PAS domain-containing protein
VTTETKPSLRILDGEAPPEPPVGLARALGEAEGRSGDHPRGLEIPAVLRSLPEGVIVFGTDGRVWATNDAARSLFGREPAPGSAASGVLAALRIAGDEPLHVDRWPVANALTGETVTEVELNVRTQSLDESASVEVPAIASVAPIHWTSGIVGVVLTVRPVPRIRDRERRWEEFVRTRRGSFGIGITYNVEPPHRANGPPNLTARSLAVYK